MESGRKGAPADGRAGAQGVLLAMPTGRAVPPAASCHPGPVGAPLGRAPQGANGLTSPEKGRSHTPGPSFPKQCGRADIGLRGKGLGLPFANPLTSGSFFNISEPGLCSGPVLAMQLLWGHGHIRETIMQTARPLEARTEWEGLLLLFLF